MEYFIGQLFDKHPGGDCAAWCNQNNAMISKLEDGTYIIIQVPQWQTQIDTSAFQNACVMFKDVCGQIADFIGQPGFMGGFDQYATFITSAAANFNKATASLLASMWSGANQYAKYQGAKLGYGQPQWWYKCWEKQLEQLKQQESSESSQDPEDTTQPSPGTEDTTQTLQPTVAPMQ